MQIDLLFLIPLMVLLITAVATWYQKLNLWVAFIGTLTAFGITYWLAPYQELVLNPLTSSLWYGYSWGYLEIVTAIHIITLFIMSGIAVYNLYMTGGKKIWT